MISRNAFDAHSDPIFKKLGILKFENIYKLQIDKFVYLYKAGLLPESFNNMFLLNCQVHPYNTRSSKSFHLQDKCKEFSINFQGPNLFNTLSHQIQDATSIASLTTMLKTFLLSWAFLPSFLNNN